MEFVVRQCHAILRAGAGQADDVLRTDVRRENGGANHPPAKVTSGQEVICRSILASRDNPPGDTEQDAEVEGDRQPVEAGESGTAELGNGEEYGGGLVHGMGVGPLVLGLVVCFASSWLLALRRLAVISAGTVFP